MRKSGRLACLCSALVLLSAVRLSAQVINNSDYLAVSTRAVIGGTGNNLSDFSTVLKVIGAGSITGASGTINPFVIDANGNTWKEDRVSLTTAGTWTFNVPWIVSGGPPQDVALGVDNVRGHLNAGTPRVTWEDAGFSQWTIDNFNGQMRFYRTSAAGIADQVPLYLDGSINVQPYSKYVVPSLGYDVSLGSIQKKFSALWVSDLFAETLVAIDSMGTVGNHLLVGTTNVLDADISPADATIIVRYNNFSNGDFVYASSIGKTEFMKVNSVATPLNKISNPSFEDGTVTNWQVSSGDTVANSTAKSFRGERSMLFTHGGTNALQIAYAGFTAATSTVYTACAYFRRVDGVIPAVGDITVTARGGTPVNLTIEPSGNDSWVRGCATFTSGTSGDTRAPFYDFSVASGASVVDYYIDNVQLEPGSAVRTYSDTRSSYDVLRNQDGGVPNQWLAGDALFNTGGASGFGWLDCYSVSGMKSTAEVGPSCVANVRTGATFNAWEPYAGWGQLNGLWEYSSSAFGFAAGPKSGPHIAIDARVSGGGIHFWQGTTEKARFDLATGNIQIGNFTNTTPVLLLTSTTMQFCVYGTGTCTFTVNGTSGNMDLAGSLNVGTSGNIRSGATSYSAGVGWLLEYNAAVPRFRVGNPAGRRVQWDGSDLGVYGDGFSLDSTGVVLKTTNVAHGEIGKMIRWMDGASLTGQIYAETGVMRAEGAGGIAGIDWTATKLTMRAGTFDSNQTRMQINQVGDIVVDIFGGPGVAALRPGANNTWDLGTSAAKWRDIYWSEPPTTGILYPLVSNAGRIMAKTNGSNGAITVAGCTITVEFGIIVGHSGC
jgi:hypothetical protein